MKVTFQIENKTINLKEKLGGLILVIIIVTLIIASSVYIVITNNNKSNNNFSEKEYIQQNSVTKEDIENVFMQNLSDEEWVKENLYIKKDYFGDEVPVYAKQNVSIAKANDYVRIALIEYEQPYTRNGKVLIYKDGNIQVQDLQNSRDGYLLDTEKNILYQYFQDMSSIGYSIYSISDNGAEKICYISAHYTGLTDEGNMILDDYKKDDVSITEEEFNNIKQQYINENINEDEIFENIDYLIRNEDISNNYSNIPEDEILKKWQATLPLNSTNGLEKVIYDSNVKELYLKYDMGICIVDMNDEINRYVQGDYEYYTADYIFNNSVEGNGIIIMTPSEFKQIIGEE